jgi:hypothetical protein
MSSSFKHGSFEAYLADFLALRRDVDLMLSRVDERGRPQDCEILYAVDFSEIFAYTYPDVTKHEVRLFSNERDIDPTQQFGINEHLLENIFFSAEAAPILLSPYAVELKRFAKSIHDEQIARILEAAKQLHDLRASGHLDEIIASHKSRPTGGLTVEEVREVLTIVEEHSPLLGVLNHDPLTSVQRFRHLLANVKFTDATDLIEGRRIEIDTDVSTWWYDGLVEARGTGRAFYCEMDAIAMAQLESLNRLLSRKSRRIRLVTRSAVMHRLWNTSPGRDDDSDPHMLCHPRAFLVHPDLLRESDVGARALDTLRELRTSLEFLTRSGALVQSDDSDTSHVGDKDGRPRSPSHLRSALLSVRQQWRSLTNLVLSTDLTRQPRTRLTHRGEEHRFARNILTLIANDARLREEVQRRVTEIGKDLMRSQETLPYSAQLSPETVGKYLEQRLSLESIGDSTALTPKALRFVNYRRIEFYAKFIRDKVGGNAKSVITQFLRHPEGQTASDYERRLAMAYLLAVNDYWELAETYCELAQSTDDSADDVPRHEVHYLLALCMRYHERSVSRLRRGLHHLDLAQQLRPGREPDPRYLAERAALILGLRGEARAANQSDMPPMQDALDASIAAIDLLADEDEMLVPIYNNLCYAFLQGDAPEDNRQAHKYYRLLREILAKKDRRRENWPPGVVDTVVCADSKLDPEPTVEKLQDLLKQLRDTLASPVLAARDKHYLEDRYREVERKLDLLASARR